MDAAKKTPQNIKDAVLSVFYFFLNVYLWFYLDCQASEPFSLLSCFSFSLFGVTTYNTNELWRKADKRSLPTGVLDSWSPWRAHCEMHQEEKLQSWDNVHFPESGWTTERGHGFRPEGLALIMKEKLKYKVNENDHSEQASCRQGKQQLSPAPSLSQDWPSHLCDAWPLGTLSSPNGQGQSNKDPRGGWNGYPKA